MARILPKSLFFLIVLSLVLPKCFQPLIARRVKIAVGQDHPHRLNAVLNANVRHDCQLRHAAQVRRQLLNN